MVIFKEKTHQYFNDSGQEYISGTTFLHKFQKPFEKEKFAALKAQKLGMTTEEVLKMWKENSIEACKFGTKTHLIMEKFILGKEKNDEYEHLYNSFNAIVEDDFKWAKQVHSELLLYSDEYKVAGTADLIIEHNDNEFSVGDFKTNKKIDFCNNWGERMLDPISHLSDCNYNLYSLQLSLYAYLFSLKTGKKCRKIFLMHLNEDKWNYIPCNYMEFEIRAMLRWYAKNQVQ
jgi:hypothetical protein